MSIHMPMPIPASAKSTEGLPDPLMHSVLRLLDGAGMDLSCEPERAGHAIRRAASILRLEIERRSLADRKDTASRKLAGWQINRVTAYIDSHLAERIQVEDLGMVARRSTAHFCRAFKQTLGETPHSFITRRRLDRAQQLMLTSDDSLSQIAVLCGFSDQAHFSNRFRQATGLTPAAWRRERREISLYGRCLQDEWAAETNCSLAET
jgi:AraC-like DNA-binding protein